MQCCISVGIKNNFKCKKRKQQGGEKIADEYNSTKICDGIIIKFATVYTVLYGRKFDDVSQSECRDFINCVRIIYECPCSRMDAECFEKA